MGTCESTAVDDVVQVLEICMALAGHWFPSKLMIASHFSMYEILCSFSSKLMTASHFSMYEMLCSWQRPSERGFWSASSLLL
jgi:hypothetical protein